MSDPDSDFLPEHLTDDPGVLAIVKDAKASFADRAISDIVDAGGKQYVDLVMEGGGVLGIALIGYTYLLEEVGIRFLGVGGTSAGAINALMLAAMGTPEEAKSQRVLEAFCAKDLAELLDGDDDALDFVEALFESKSALAKTWKLLQVLDNLKEDLGLNPGEAVLAWIQRVLGQHGIISYADLEAKLSQLPVGLAYRDGRPITTHDEAGSRLAVVATDVTTETKVIFPDMADLYYSEPEHVSPAEFVRASMSIPFFFHPYLRRGLPKTPSLVRRWEECCGIQYDSATEIPDEVLFVDGGLVSNFPIAIFHQSSSIPTAPTFGVKLGYDTRHNRVAGPLQFFDAVFKSSRHCLDYDFVSKNPDYRWLVATIAVKGFHWLDFQMSDKKKIALFRAGVLAAAEFLQSFDWTEYKKIRASLVQATRPEEG